jgi:hypothetical protein
MLTIEHEHINILIMLTMVIFNTIALNGFSSKKFNILQTFFFVFIVRQKICQPCTGKSLYVMFTESRQESLEPKVREEISFHLGGKISIFLTGLNGLYLLMQTHCAADLACSTCQREKV